MTRLRPHFAHSAPRGGSRAGAPASATSQRTHGTARRPDPRRPPAEQLARRRAARSATASSSLRGAPARLDEEQPPRPRASRPRRRGAPLAGTSPTPVREQLSERPPRRLVAAWIARSNARRTRGSSRSSAGFGGAAGASTPRARGAGPVELVVLDRVVELPGAHREPVAPPAERPLLVGSGSRSPRATPDPRAPPGRSRRQ